MSARDEVTLVEDMTFSEEQPDGTALTAIITNVDLGRVNVRYERAIVDNAGSGGVIYDVEDAGGDTFDEEAVFDMIDNGTWKFISAPMQEPLDGDDA